MSDPRVMNVVKVQQTCLARPSQWEGRLEDGRVVYVRYRYGRLQVGVGANLDEATDDETTFFHKLSSDPLDGALSYEGLQAATAGTFTWPDEVIAL